ncbi:MAG: RNase adapter RapZ [Bradymonadia bacterium]
MSEPKLDNSLRLMVITGLSGSGISTASHALEDLGFFCVDNLPPQLVPKLIDLAQSSQKFDRLAIGLDARNVEDVQGCLAMLETLKDMGIQLEIVYLEASDDVLLRRFSVSRRPHPLGRYGLPIAEAIQTERLIMHPIRERASRILDSSDLNVHECKRLVQTYANGGQPRDLFISVMSFGFRYGVPSEADVVWDVRFLPNPHFVDELRPQTGLDRPVQDYVYGRTETVQFLEHFLTLLDTTLPAYENEGKSHLTIAIGCTGGKHRSVAISERVSNHLRLGGRDPRIRHRDIGKESS